MSNKKKILLIGSELGKGGAERSISLLSYYLSLQYDVKLCILSGTSRDTYYKTCEKVVFIDPPVGRSITGKIRAWRYRIHRVKELKADFQPDVSISFLEGPDFVNIITKGKDKVVISIRGSKQFDQFIAGYSGWIRKKLLIPFLYKKADKVVCVTKALADEMHRYFGISSDQLRIIYNFYEPESIREKCAEQLTAQEASIFDKPVIINSGRLHAQKEQEKLITVFSHVRQKKECRLVILGDGELKTCLVRHSQKLGLEVCDAEAEPIHAADVYFLGFQANPFKFYQHSKLFALSSSWEGFPNVLAEALLCELPVVCADCPTGPREILHIDNLTEEPISKAIRKEAGTLLPLLANANEEVYTQWTNAIVERLDKRPVTSVAFADLSRRFTKEEALQQWRVVIEEWAK